MLLPSLTNTFKTILLIPLSPYPPFILFMTAQFSSVTQPCPTLCYPMDCSTLGLPVHHQLPEFTQTHVHWVSDSTISSSVVPFSSRLQSFPASESFQMSQFFTSGGQSIGVSASTSILPMNIQDWFPLGWTGWISLLSKGLSRVFYTTTVHDTYYLKVYYSCIYLITCLFSLL